MLEVYRTKWVVRYKSQVVAQTFYWLANNTLGVHSHELATEIDRNIFDDTNWANLLSSLCSSSATLRMFSTRRIRPTGGPSTVNRYFPANPPGLYPSPVGDDFITCNLQWHFPGDFTGKNQVRIGPLGEGATGPDFWTTAFSAVALFFISAHCTPRITISAVPFRGCAIDHLGIANAITSGTLCWPPGRQRNRRWVA